MLTELITENILLYTLWGIICLIGATGMVLKRIGLLTIGKQDNNDRECLKKIEKRLEALTNDCVPTSSCDKDRKEIIHRLEKGDDKFANLSSELKEVSDNVAYIKGWIDRGAKSNGGKE